MGSCLSPVMKWKPLIAVETLEALFLSQSVSVGGSVSVGLLAHCLPQGTSWGLARLVPPGTVITVPGLFGDSVEGGRNSYVYVCIQRGRALFENRVGSKKLC